MSGNNKMRLPEAYEHMVERAAAAFGDTEKTKVTLQKVFEEVKNKAVELGELTREEAEQVADFVQHDVHDMARNISEKERDFADWLRLDILLIEKPLLKRVTRLVEVAGQELKHAVKEPMHPLDWHTGEVTGIGSLVCHSCGEEIHFHQAGHIPPCPKCSGSHFQRNWKSDS